MSAQVGRFVASKDGTKIWAEDAGNKSGIPVVFVHGLSCTGHAWDKQFSDKTLLANLYMIRYELRGHSRSDKPMTAEFYTQEKYAEDFVAVSEAFGLKKPFLCGWYAALILILLAHDSISTCTFAGVSEVSDCVLTLFSSQLTSRSPPISRNSLRRWSSLWSEHPRRCHLFWWPCDDTLPP